MDFLLTFLALAAPIVGSGALLLALSRWARRKNNVLIRPGTASSAMSAAAALKSGRVGEFARLLFLGNVSRTESEIGRVLAVAVILFVLTVLISIAVVLLGAYL